MAKRIFGIKKKQASGFVLVVALALMVLSGFSGNSILGSVGSGPQAPVASTASAVDDGDTQVVATGTQKGLLRVTKVVDGDTIEVEVAGKTEKIRMLGVNTPETVDPRRPVECYGKEASDHAKLILADASVELVADASQGDADKYGRLLRYVVMADGTDFGRTMIQDGYAYEYTYDKPYARQAEYKAAQAEAQAQKRGLWAQETCGGNR